MYYFCYPQVEYRFYSKLKKRNGMQLSYTADFVTED